MGGAGAPDDLDAASMTQAWLAVSDDEAAQRSGAVYYHQQPIESSGTGAESVHPSVTSEAFQDDLLAALAELTGTELPASGKPSTLDGDEGQDATHAAQPSRPAGA